MPPPSQFPSAGLFSKVDIDLNALARQLPSSDADFDTRSTMTSKSLRGLNLTKKEKMKLKHEFLIKSTLIRCLFCQFTESIVICNTKLIQYNFIVTLTAMQLCIFASAGCVLRL